MKILVINPFATGKYDDVVASVCNKVRRADTELKVEHLNIGLPFIRHRYFKSLIIPEIVERCIVAEKTGFDGVFVSCCFEPGVEEAREVVDIPVVGGSAPPVYIVRQLGQRFGFITDTGLANTITYEVFKQNKLDDECTSIQAVEIGVEDIAKNPAPLQEKVIQVIRQLMAEGADSVIIGCTIVAAFFDYENIPDDLKGVPIIDANVAAIKTVETLAELRIKANITVSRKVYVKPQDVEEKAFHLMRDKFGTR